METPSRYGWRRNKAVKGKWRKRKTGKREIKGLELFPPFAIFFLPFS
jgi:hypothetical protein